MKISRNSILTTLLVLLVNLNNVYAQWIPIGPGSNMGVMSLVATSGNFIFAGTFLNGCYLTTNNGQNWSQTTLHYATINAFLITGNEILAGTNYLNSGIYITTDNGQNWSPYFSNQLVLSFAQSGNNIFAGTQNGVFMSTDSGQNWSQTSLNNRNVHSLTINSNIIFAGTTVFGIYTSTNNGQNWTQSSLNNHYVWALAVSGNNILAGTENGVYISTNNGQTWTLSSNTQITLSLAVSGNNIFAGTDTTGVYYSSNGGATWIRNNDGMGNFAVYSLLIFSNYIYAGTYTHSAYRRLLSDFIGIKIISNIIPENFHLYQNYPNPFNPTTSIEFDISISSYTKLIIYDLNGKELETLVNEELRPGSYRVIYNNDNLSSGIYFYKFVTSKFSQTKRMVLLK